VKDDSLNSPACGNCADGMPEFVDGHHCQPAQRQEGADQQGLVEAFHRVAVIAAVSTYVNPLLDGPAALPLSCPRTHTQQLSPHTLRQDKELCRWLD